MRFVGAGLVPALDVGHANLGDHKGTPLQMQRRHGNWGNYQGRSHERQQGLVKVAPVDDETAAARSPQGASSSEGEGMGLPQEIKEIPKDKGR